MPPRFLAFLVALAVLAPPLAARAGPAHRARGAHRGAVRLRAGADRDRAARDGRRGHARSPGSESPVPRGRPAALEWYKKALAVDPDFGDAYFDMACVYALQGERELALHHLQIAALNGSATAEGIDADPDLARLRRDPAYQALVKERP